jgi:hypothetical protein
MMDIDPHRHVQVRFCVPDEVHAVLGAAEEHVDAVLSAQKPNFGLVVAADERDNDDLGLFPLEIVDCGQADCLQQLFLFHRPPRPRNCRLLLLPVLHLEALLREGLKVAITEEDLKVLAQGGAQFLKLAGVRRQKGNVGGFILALSHQVADQGRCHRHLPGIAV